MTDDVSVPRSRRALLAAAAGGAAALAASAALPLTAAATDPYDLALSQVNVAGGTTQLDCIMLDADALVVNAANANTGSGVVASGAHAPGVRAYSGEQAALYALNGDQSHAATQAQTIVTGVYGWAPTAPDPTVSVGSGVWGDSDDVGVYGSGGTGVYGYGGVGVVGESASTSAGVLAVAKSATDLALDVRGKAHFSRSGRSNISAGASSKLINLAGVTSGSKVFALLHSNRSGRYVRAVVPATGRFRIYLNASVSSTTSVAWFVLD